MRYGFDRTAVLAHLMATVPNKAERLQLYSDMCVMEQAAVVVHQELAAEAFERMQNEANAKANSNAHNS